jgi:peptide/nickel transport system substrate-binding protein
MKDNIKNEVNTILTMKDNIKNEVNTISWRGIQYDRSLDPGPLADQRVRQAFAMAIDKKTITDNVLKGLAVPTDSFSGDPEVASKVKPLSFDVAKAKQLLADAGFPNGQGFPELTFYAPPANDPQMPMIEAVVKMWQDNLGVPIKIQNNENAVYNTLQWSDYNKDIEPGFATLGGVMNWFQPEDLVLSTNHIWFFMDYQGDGMTKYADYKDQIAEVTNLTAAGDWAALETRANDAWARRQEIVAKENNQYGKNMLIAPTFKDQWDAIAKRQSEAADDAAKLSAYQDGLTLVLKEEQCQAQYDAMTEANREAQRQLADLRLLTVDKASENLVPLLQAAVDSAWMIPIYNEKLYYVTDTKLSGVVLNKLSWGGSFQYQYLQWND